MNIDDIRLFASDLDGTLLYRYGTISQEGIRTLKKLRERGIIVVICSGRPLYSVRKTIPDGLYDYACCMNGQDIYCVKEDSHQYQPYIDEASFAFLSNLAHGHNVIYSVCFEEHSDYYISERFRAIHVTIDLAKQLAAKILRIKRYPMDVRPDSEIHFEHGISKVCYAGRHKTLLKIRDAAKTLHMSTFFVNEQWPEIQTPGISKGSALHRIMAREGIPKDSVLTAGDGENDLSMFAAGGTSVAMKNAMPAVKEAASIIIGHYAQDALVKWLNENFLS